MNIPRTSIIGKGKLAAAEAAHNFATILRAGWQDFWQRDPTIVIAELNADIVAIGETFALNTQAGTAINAILDAISDDRFPTRAPVDLPEGYSFSGTEWVFNLPVVETLEEEPTPP